MALLLTLAVPAIAQPQGAPSGVRAARLERPPVIDGRMDEDVWSQATRLEGFRQVQPGDNTEPSERTTAWVAHDRRALYLAFRADDASGKVRATIARRDAISDDDIVGVYLDTFNDRRRAYYLFFNPHGVQADGIHTEGKAEPDLTVDLVMESRGTVDANGYTVEVSIPFASLRYRSGASPTWGLHVQRFIRRDRNEQISWMPLSRDRSSFLGQAGQLGEFSDVGEGRPLEIIPTGTATQTGSMVASGRLEGRSEMEPGVTVKLGVTPTFNATFTANPDFAQVAADQLVLTVNQRFPLFYEEKRPFFLEGIDVFQTPINIFHTRTIVAPDHATKVTATQGRTTFGALFAEDGASKLAVRLKRDIGRESSLGTSLTGVREGNTYSNLVSVDTRLRLSPQTVFTGQIAGTFAEMPFRDETGGGTSERAGEGLGYHANLERRARHATLGITASGYSPDYRAELGFTRLVNMNALAVRTAWRSEPRPDAWLISWSATHIAHAQWNWQRRATFIYTYPQLEFTLRRQTFVRAYAYRDYERIFEEEFGVRRSAGRAGAFAGRGERSTNWKGFFLQAGIAPTEKIAVSFSWSNSWDVFDYDLGAGPKYPRVSPDAIVDPDAPLDPGPATSHSMGAEVTWRPQDALRLSVEASRNTLVRDDNGQTAYDATLVSWRTTYQFTRFAFARLRTDWNSASATLRGQYLLGWTPNAVASIYAGYNDASTVDGFDPATGVPVRGFRRHGRTLFLKMSWLSRFVL